MPGKSYQKYKENNRFCTLLLQFCFFYKNQGTSLCRSNQVPDEVEITNKTCAHAGSLPSIQARIAFSATTIYVKCRFHDSVPAS